MIKQIDETDCGGRMLMPSQAVQLGLALLGKKKILAVPLQRACCIKNEYAFMECCDAFVISAGMSFMLERVW